VRKRKKSREFKERRKLGLESIIRDSNSLDKEAKTLYGN